MMMASTTSTPDPEQPGTSNSAPPVAEQQIACSGSKPRPSQYKANEIRIIDVEYEVPAFLRDHYQFSYFACKSEEEKTPSVLALKCTVGECAKIIRAPTKNKDNFKKHLKSAHHIDCNPKQQSVVPVGQTKIQSFFGKPKQEVKIDAALQMKVDRGICDMVSLDGLPLNFVNGIGFQNFVKTCIGNVNIISRPTVGSRIRKYNTDFSIPSITADFRLQPSDSIHISSDIWTSNNAEAVITAKAHFIDKEWKLRSEILGFASFPGAHTSARIKDALEKLFGDRNIAKNQVGALITDNAANMIKAANLSDFFSDKWATANSTENGGLLGFGLSENAETGDDLELSQSECTTPDDELIFTEDEISTEDNIDLQGLHGWQISCACHTLQLGINETIRGCEEVLELVNYLNSIIVCFRKSPKRMSELRQVSSKILLTIGTTRWNSIFTAMERLIDDNLYLKVQQLLLKYQSTEGNKIKAPTFAYRAKWRDLVTMLRPVKQLTDKLQGNYVTSSRLLTATELCLFELTNLNPTHFSEFRDNLLSNIMDRFRRYFEDKTFWIATFLDNRLGYGFFESDLKLLLTVDPVELLLIIRSEIPEKPKTNSSQEAKRPKLSEENEFNYYRKEEDEKDEVDSYIAFIKHEKYREMCPLQFWKENASVFPNLANIARKYLAIPSSSGDAERVFSVSGNIKRARRAKIKIDTVESLLLYRQHRGPFLREKLKKDLDSPNLN